MNNETWRTRPSVAIRSVAWRSYKKKPYTHTYTCLLLRAAVTALEVHTVFVVSSETLNSFDVFIGMWLQTPQGPRITVVLWSNLRKLLCKPVENKKDSVFPRLSCRSLRWCTNACEVDPVEPSVRYEYVYCIWETKCTPGIHIDTWVFRPGTQDLTNYKSHTKP